MNATKCKSSERARPSNCRLPKVCLVLLAHFALLACLFAAPLAAQDEASKAYDDFVRWRDSQPAGKFGPGISVPGLYRQKLIQDGLTGGEADRLLELINKERDRREAARWNKAFADPTSRINRKPNQLLVDSIRGRKPGKALDIGMGMGRNSLFLAENGWEVCDLRNAHCSRERARDTRVSASRRHRGDRGIRVSARRPGERLPDSAPLNCSSCSRACASFAMKKPRMSRTSGWGVFP